MNILVLSIDPMTENLRVMMIGAREAGLLLGAPPLHPGQRTEAALPLRSSSSWMKTSCTLLLLGAAAARAAPVQLIVDTDLGFDVDDVGAIAVANNLADEGYCDILAIVHNTGFYEGIGGVSVLNNWWVRARRARSPPCGVGRMT